MLIRPPDTDAIPPVVSNDVASTGTFCHAIAVVGDHAVLRYILAALTEFAARFVKPWSTHAPLTRSKFSPSVLRIAQSPSSSPTNVPAGGVPVPL